MDWNETYNARKQGAASEDDANNGVSSCVTQQSKFICQTNIKENAVTGIGKVVELLEVYDYANAAGKCNMHKDDKKV